MAFMNMGGKNDDVPTPPPGGFQEQSMNDPNQMPPPGQDPYADSSQQYYPQDQMAPPQDYGDYNYQQPMDQGMPPPMDMGPGPDPNMDRMRIEEMAEAIIDEKWEEMLKNISKIAEWKDISDSKITKLEQEMKDLKENFDRLHKAIIGKISEYDRNILNVGTEIKAMEKVFQKIIPTFTENVSELSRITRNMGTKAKALGKK